MKKKIMATIMTLALSVSALTACGGKSSVSIDASALADSLVNDITYESELSKLSEDEITNYIDVLDGVEGIMYMSSGSTAEEVVVLTTPDESAAQTMYTNVQQFLKDQKSSFEDYIPAEAKRIDDAVTVQKGNYVVVCVSGDSDKAKEIVDQAFEKQNFGGVFDIPFFTLQENTSYRVKTLRVDAHLAEMQDMLRIPLGRERVASDSLFTVQKNGIEKLYDTKTVSYMRKENGIQQFCIFDGILTIDTCNLLYLSDEIQKPRAVSCEFDFLCMGRTEICVDHAVFNGI